MSGGGSAGGGGGITYFILANKKKDDPKGDADNSGAEKETPDLSGTAQTPMPDPDQDPDDENDPDFDNPESFRGADFDDVVRKADRIFLRKGWKKAPLKRGKGVRYYDGKGNYVRVNKGYKNADDPVHGGPYMNVYIDGKLVRIPLKNNPIIK